MAANRPGGASDRKTVRASLAADRECQCAEQSHPIANYLLPRYSLSIAYTQSILLCKVTYLKANICNLYISIECAHGDAIGCSYAKYVGGRCGESRESLRAIPFKRHHPRVDEVI